MEEMLSQLIKSQDAIAKSQGATAKSLENRMVENARSLEAKVSELAKSQSELHTSTDDKLSQITYHHNSFDHPLVTCPGEVQNGQIVQSTTADSGPFTQKPTLRDETESQFILD